VRGSHNFPSRVRHQQPMLHGRTLSLSLDQQQLRQAVADSSFSRLEAVPESSRGNSSTGGSLKSSVVLRPSVRGSFAGHADAEATSGQNLGSCASARSIKAGASEQWQRPEQAILCCSPLGHMPVSQACTAMLGSRAREDAEGSLRSWASLMGSAGSGLQASGSGGVPDSSALIRQLNSAGLGVRERAQSARISATLSLGDIPDHGTAHSHDGSCAHSHAASFTLTPPHEFNSMVRPSCIICTRGAVAGHAHWNRRLSDNDDRP
jgi:hypothetical protein